MVIVYDSVEFIEGFGVDRFVWMESIFILVIGKFRKGWSWRERKVMMMGGFVVKKRISVELRGWFYFEFVRSKIRSDVVVNRFEVSKL